MKARRNLDLQTPDGRLLVTMAFDNRARIRIIQACICTGSTAKCMVLRQGRPPSLIQECTNTNSRHILDRKPPSTTTIYPRVLRHVRSVGSRTMTMTTVMKIDCFPLKYWRFWLWLPCIGGHFGSICQALHRKLGNDLIVLN